jgi:hypothetical protein
MTKGERMERREVLKTGLTAAALGVTAPSLALADEQTERQTSGEKQPSKIQITETVLRYVAAWSERDPKRRLELVARTWVEDGTYIDVVRQGRGHENISAMIAKAVAPYPGYRFSLASGIETHNEYVRFSWLAGGTPDTPLYFKGTDIAVLGPDGRFKAIIGFVDAAP